MEDVRKPCVLVLTSMVILTALVGCSKKAAVAPAATPVAPAATPVAPAAMTVAQGATPAGTAPLALSPTPSLGKNLDALPLLAHATTPALQRINATLKKLNDETKADAAQCTGGDSDYEQTVTPLMLGPKYLSFYLGGTEDCGGPYPATSASVMLFDLSTGAAVDWVKLVHAPGVKDYADTGANGKDGAPQALIDPALLKLYLADPDNAGDCQTAYQDPQPFLIWPEPKSGELMVQAFDLPHVTQACANNMSLTPEQAKALGFDAGLLSALAEAHQQPGASKLAMPGD